MPGFIFRQKNGSKAPVFQIIKELKEGFALFWLSLTGKVFLDQTPPHTFVASF
jgi:hypothetical protein